MSTSFRVILPYRYFAVCDWITEPGIAETNALLALARSEVAASDGRQIIVCPASESAVTVHFEHLGDAPAGGDDAWEDIETPAWRLQLVELATSDMQNRIHTDAFTRPVAATVRGDIAPRVSRPDSIEFVVDTDDGMKAIVTVPENTPLAGRRHPTGVTPAHTAQILGIGRSKAYEPAPTLTWILAMTSCV